jgi:hypothetical protein
MRRIRLTACVAAGILAWSTGGRAHAQGYLPQAPGNTGPITQPVYSPYLNLLRPGGNLAQNYFGLVRPELDLRNAAGTLQQQTYQNSQYLNALAYSGSGYYPLVTGHSATFLSLQGRFLNLRGSGYGGGSHGAGVGTAPGPGAYGAGAGAGAYGGPAA